MCRVGTWLSLGGQKQMLLAVTSMSSVICSPLNPSLLLSCPPRPRTRGREQDANRERMQRERMQRRLEEAERRKPIGSKIVALRQFESSSSKTQFHENFLRFFFQNILI